MSRIDRSMPNRHRQGGMWAPLLVLLGLSTAGGLAGWYYLGPQAKVEVRPLTHEVSRGPFSHVVTENGEIESSSNIEVRCEVQAKGTSGTSILEIVPEGALVEKGDVIARLDSSALQNEFDQQQIKVNASEAVVIKARSAANTAKIALDEYVNGTFRQEEQLIQSEISVNEENLSRAQDYAAYSRKLAAKGYVTPLQLEADEFAVEKAKMDLEAARTKLDVLRKFTKVKMTAQLEADIEAANATLQSENQNFALDKDKLEQIRAQLAKCEIRAPASGQVVYANSAGGGRGGGGSEVIIEAGTVVRERQAIVRLPDPAKMQVKAKINESRIDRVTENMPAIVKLDAFPDEQLSGMVRRVDDYPLSGNWWSSVKEYATYVEIVNPPPGRLRPGMTAEVQIFVEQIPDAVQVPVQAVLEHSGQHYCLTYAQEQLRAVEVEIGSTNEKFVVIRNGIDAGAEVLVNPRRYEDRVNLPKITELETQRMLAAKSLPAAVPKAEATSKPTGGLAEKPRSESAASGDAAGGDRVTKEGDIKQVAATDAVSDSKADNADKAAGEEGEKKPRRSAGGGAGGFANMDPAQMAKTFIEQSDKDGDGKLSEEEYPEQFRSRFASTDSNGDKKVDSQEIAVALRKMQSQMRAGGMPGGPPGAGRGGPPNAGGQ